MVWFFNTRRKRADKLFAAGKVAKALALYQKENAWDGVVRAYKAMGDLPGAAESASEGGLYEQAAMLYEQLGRLRDAAAMWLKCDQKEQAARAYERSGLPAEAAALYIELENFEKAANLLIEQGQPGDAAPLYERAGNFESAVAAYREAGELAEVARLLEASGEFEKAAQVWLDMNEKTAAAQLFKRAGRVIESANLFADVGDFAQAGTVLEEGDYPLQAAEYYEKDASMLTRAATLLGKCLKTVDDWQRDFPSQMTCFDMTTVGGHIVLGCDDSYAYLLDESGKTIWRLRPVVGARALCAAVSHEATCVVGFDDRRLRLIGKDRSVIWAVDLPEEPTAVDMDASGERIICAAGVNSVIYFDAAGALVWRHPVKGTICDLAISPNGELIAIATVEGSCLFMNTEGESAGEFKAVDWVDAVCLSDDGTKCALVVGMDGVALLDVARSELIWSAQECSAVHDATLTADNTVLSVSDREVVLRDASGAVLARHRSERRLMGGRISGARHSIVVWDAERSLRRLDIQDCRLRAAQDYEKAESYKEAAALYETLGEHAQAAESYKAAGDLRSAARNIEVAGDSLEAAALYESLGDHQKAAPIFEASGELDRAAHCFSEAGQLVRAARLFEQANDPAQAAELFERAGQHDKAGALYKAADNTEAAIRAWATHLEAHPDATELALDLGILLQADGQYDRAIDCLQKATRNKEQLRTALMRLAECFVAKNLYDIALSRYEACLEDGEKVAWENLEIYYGMGKTYQLAGNYPESRRVFESILAINYNYEDVQKRLADVQALSSVLTSSQSQSPFAAEKTVIVGRDNPYQRLSADTKDRYVVTKELGRGGMGTVFLAEDKKLKRNVALKILAPHLAADQGIKARMVHEAQAAAQLDHPNCVGVFDVGDDGDRCYMTMEYITGSTLRQLINEKGKLEVEEAVPLLIQATDGLAYAHSKGILHRDIKPDNVIIASDGTVKLMDFGLALVQGATRLTMEGGACGTLAYIAPEQLRGDRDLTAGVDVYSVGCMAFEMLTGELPFDEADMGRARLTQPPKALISIRTDLPDSLVKIVNKCLGIDPSDRYPDGASLNAALREVGIGS